MWRIKALLCLLLLCSAQSFGSANESASDSPVKVKLTCPQEKVHAGETITVMVEFEIEEGWHVYSQDPQTIGKPTKVELLVGGTVVVGKPSWPQSQPFEESGFHYFGYTGRLAVPVTVTVPADAAGTIEVQAKTSWLACNDACVPGSADLKLVLPVVAAAAPVSSAGGWQLLYFMSLAFVGGMILNLMPCVLPVVSLKILSFARQAGEDKRQIFRLGLAYMGGTLAAFTVLALMVIILQQLGIAVGWGFHFQHPAFVLAMASLVVVLAVSMFGVFHIQVNAGTSSLSGLSQKEGWKGAFFTGVLATLLSTPCTAPFLGTALAFAFTQHWLVILVLFLTIGAGLSAPYVVLSWQPAWLKLLPKPGDWMVRFKEAMGFAMLLTAIWLLSVLVAQCGPGALLPAALWLTTLTFCSWLIGSFAPPFESARRRRSIWAVALVVTALAGWLLLPSTLARQSASVAGGATLTGEAYSPEALQRHLAAGDVVLLDFTAQWCLTCQVYEQTVLSSSEVQAALKANKAVVLRCDWTNGDAEITALLQKFGRSGVPLYVVYSPHRAETPQVLPDILTRASLIQALEAARKP